MELRDSMTSRSLPYLLSQNSSLDTKTRPMWTCQRILAVTSPCSQTQCDPGQMAPGLGPCLALDLSAQNRPHREPGKMQPPQLESQHSTLPILTLPSEALAGACLQTTHCQPAQQLRSQLPGSAHPRHPALEHLHPSPLGEEPLHPAWEGGSPRCKVQGNNPWHPSSPTVLPSCTLHVEYGQLEAVQGSSVQTLPRRALQLHFLSESLCRAHMPRAEGYPASRWLSLMPWCSGG